MSEIVLRRHYLRRRATPPRTLVLSYLASLGGDGAAALVQVALLPGNFGPLLPALGLHQTEVLQLVRSWRADDLGPDVAPDLLPEILRRVIKRLREDWTARKCANLTARPRLLVTYADPAVGHDGGLYVGAGAVPLGPTRSGRLAFGWALEEALRAPLRAYALCVATRARA